MRKRQTQNLATWTVLVGEQVEAVIRSHLDGDDFVFKSRDLGPVSGRVHQVVSKLAAVSVGYGCDQPAAVVAGAQMNFSDTREIFPDDVGILVRVRAELVIVNLLIEIGVFRWPLVALWIARVIKTGVIGFPVEAASGSREVDPRHAVWKFLPGGDFEDVGDTVFRPVFRQRDGDELAVERGNIKIHGDRSRRGGRVGIEDDFLAGGIRRQTWSHQQWLLLGRLAFHSE